MIAEIVALTVFLSLFSLLILGSQAGVTPKSGRHSESIETVAHAIDIRPDEVGDAFPLTLSSAD